MIYGTLLGVVLSIVVASLHHRIAARNEFQRGMEGLRRGVRGARVDPRAEVSAESAHCR